MQGPFFSNVYLPFIDEPVSDVNFAPENPHLLRFYSPPKYSHSIGNAHLIANVNPEP